MYNRLYLVGQHKTKTNESIDKQLPTQSGKQKAPMKVIFRCLSTYIIPNLNYPNIIEVSSQRLDKYLQSIHHPSITNQIRRFLNKKIKYIYTVACSGKPQSWLTSYDYADSSYHELRVNKNCKSKVYLVQAYTPCGIILSPVIPAGIVLLQIV